MATFQIELTGTDKEETIQLIQGWIEGTMAAIQAQPGLHVYLRRLPDQAPADHGPLAKGLTELSKQLHATASEKGWWPQADRTAKIPETIALIHSEASEALECYRDGQISTSLRDGDEKPEGFGVELADVVIRALDALAAYGFDAGELVALKHRYNQTRPHRHGGKAC